MRRVLPILVSIFIVTLAGFIAFYYLDSNTPSKTVFQGEFKRSLSCKRKPLFLANKGAVYIDLSQQRYKGIAFWYGRGFKRVIHQKEWERYGSFGTYTLDKNGNLYLAPIPFISIEKDTFKNQKWIYKLDSKNKKLTKWLKIDEVLASGANPYGVISIDYDCDDNTLWVSAIDKSNYQEEKGRLYHIDIKTKKILEKYEGYDFLTIKILKTSKAKYLIGGSAREPSVLAWEIKDHKLSKLPTKLFEILKINLRVRKIHIKSKNMLILEAIPFSYSLIAQSSNNYRVYFLALWNLHNNLWKVKKLNK